MRRQRMCLVVWRGVISGSFLGSEGLYGGLIGGFMFVGCVQFSMSQRSMAGGFGERALERIVSEDMFVSASVEGVVISCKVDYYSGSLGGAKHTGSVSVIERWEESDNREVRTVGVSPELFVELYVRSISERVTVKMSASDIVELGDFSNLTGHFKLDVSEVDVKVSSDSVEIEGMGTFARESVSDSMSYSSWVPKNGRFGDKEYRCGVVAESRLRLAWAESEGISSGVWTIEDVVEYDYSDSVRLEVGGGYGEVLEFSFSMDDWDDNASIRKLVGDVGGGVTSNLELEDVWVSLKDISGVEPVAECGDWKLYCLEDRPNMVYRWVSGLL